MARKQTVGRLYVVATSHLDTQWRWTVRDTIERFLPATFAQAFERFAKYPYFVLSFEGAFRYRLIQEYYPEAYDRLADSVRRGRWHPAGSMVDAPDVNIVAPESLIRQILYGNRFFERHLGVRSRDIFLPDCFGFGWALPTIARHCGLEGFSSQKLNKWTRPGGIPFDLGMWEGPDGSRVVAALRPGGYGDKLLQDPSRDPEWIARVGRLAESSGVAVGYRYFGVGDRGGAPDEASIENLGRGLDGGGALEVVHAGSDRIFADLTDAERARLPVYAGEIQLPTHGTGCWTSQLAMKRWNRRCESLGDAAERAACLAAWVGAMEYPAAELRRAWEGFLWHQMHDDLTGTSIPAAYRLSWNDQLLALNRFSTVLTDAVTAVARAMATDGPTKAPPEVSPPPEVPPPEVPGEYAPSEVPPSEVPGEYPPAGVSFGGGAGGVPIVVYNPLDRRRREPVTARVRFAGPAPAAVRVLAPGGIEIASQTLGRGDDFLDLLFLADVRAVGLAVYRVEPAAADSGATPELRIDADGLENTRYRVAVSALGEIESIFDKRLRRELLAAPVTFQLLPDRSRRWPAWELLFRDVTSRPRAFSGRRDCRIEVEERGPVRVALRIEHRRRGSTLVQRLRLYGDGLAAERLESACDLDWRTWRRMLKVAFPLAAASPTATYDLGLGAIERGINTETAYEVPAQRWAAQAVGPASDPGGDEARGGEPTAGGWTVTVFTDAGYGWDKPDATTLRHTLARSPRARHHFRHQRHQDFGRHRFTLALAAQPGGPGAGDTAFHAASLHQPLLAFQTAEHPGPLGRELSFLDLDGDGLEVRALKRIEDPEGVGAGDGVERGPRPGLAAAVDDDGGGAAPVAETGDQEWVVRLVETRGAGGRASLALGRGLVAAREVNGCEQPAAADTARPVALRAGRLEVEHTRFQPRTFALRARPPETPVAPLESWPLALPWDLTATSFHHRPLDVDFDGRGQSLPGELLPARLTCGEIPFRLGPRRPEALNAMVCRGQRLALPAAADTVFLLATGVADDDEEVEIGAGADGESRRLTVHPWSGFLGQRNRWPQYRGWRIGDERPAYLRPALVAWAGTHRHGPGVTDQAYVFCYLYRYEVALPEGTTELRFPDARSVRVFAATAARRGAAALRAATSLIEPTFP